MVGGRCKEQARTFYELYNAGEEVFGDDVEPKVIMIMSSDCEQDSTIMSACASTSPLAHRLPVYSGHQGPCISGHTYNLVASTQYLQQAATTKPQNADFHFVGSEGVMLWPVYRTFCKQPKQTD